MAAHRSLVISKFHAGVGPDLLVAYFHRLGLSEEQAALSAWNIDALNHLLEDRKDLAAVVLEDFNRMNDVCETSYGVLARQYDLAHLPLNPEATREAQAMNIFLHYPDHFDRAYSRYLLIAGDAAMSVYSLPITPFVPTATQEEGFRQGVETWFKETRKDEAVVLQYDDYDERVILIKHGSNPKNLQLWSERKESPLLGRLAEQDTLIYERDTGVLRVKAVLPKDGDFYLSLFAEQYAGNGALADKARKEEMFSLEPVHTRRFDYGGRGPIVRVELARVVMKVYGQANTEVSIKASDVRDAFKYDLGQLDFDSGILTVVWFRFHLFQAGRRNQPVTCLIRPLATIRRLRERWYRQPILDYLKEQGVKLQ